MLAIVILIFISKVLTSPVPFYYGGDFEYPDIYEEVVPLECTDLEIPCETDRICLQFSDFCNGVKNCSDNLDERDCKTETTAASDYKPFTDLVEVSEAETTSSYQTYYYYETTALES